MKKIITAIVMLTTVIIGLLYINFKTTITRENTIEYFCKNISYFDVIKDYMLTKPKDYYINLGTYKTEIDDEKVVEAVNYLVRGLKYERIYNYSTSNDKKNYYIVFLRGGNNNDEFGIIYTGKKTNNYGITMELIEGNWYFHWMGYV